MEFELSQAISPVHLTPCVDTDTPDFTRRLDPDGSHGTRIFGGRPSEPQSQKLTELLARPRPVERQDNGAPWQRNPLQVSMDPPPVCRRRQPSHVVDAAVRAGLEEMISADSLTLSTSPSGQRMLVVDEAFYGQPCDPNWRPRPIREGAGRGPRKQAPHNRVGC